MPGEGRARRILTGARAAGAGARATLRRPAAITAVLAIVAAGCVAMAAIPQVSRDARGLRSLEASSPLLASVVRTLDLHDVLHARWFAAACLLAFASLAVVVVDGWRRVLRQWSATPSDGAFRSAPYRRVLRRPARGEEGARFETRGRAALLGSPLFHTGLALVMLAGLLRMLVGAEAAVDLLEGETLDAAPSAFGAQWPGRLAAPFSWPRPLRVERITPELWAAGGLKALRAEMTSGSGDTASLAINEPLRSGARWLYVSAEHGPAALLEWQTVLATAREALLLEEADARYEGIVHLPDGSVVLASAPRAGADLPDRVEVRALRGGALLGVGELRPGEQLVLPGGERLALHGLRRWARFRGSRDPSVELAYAGFGLVAAGALLMFAVVRVDKAAVVTREGDGEVVVLALRAQRFAPLYAEEFEQWVAEHAGPGVQG